MQIYSLSSTRKNAVTENSRKENKSKNLDEGVQEKMLHSLSQDIKVLMKEIQLLKENNRRNERRCDEGEQKRTH